MTTAVPAAANQPAATLPLRLATVIPTMADTMITGLIAHIAPALCYRPAAAALTGTAAAATWSSPESAALE